MKLSLLGAGAKTVLAALAISMLAAPACAPLARRTDAIAAARAPLDPSAPARTSVGDLQWRGSLHLAPPDTDADAQLSVVGSGAQDATAPVLAAVFSDGSLVSAPLAFDPNGALVGLKNPAPRVPEDTAAAAALADAAADDADSDDAEALLVADAPSLSVAGDGRIWRCADPGETSERCRLIGKAPSPRASGSLFRLVSAERLAETDAYALLWAGHDAAQRLEAVVTVFAPTAGRPSFDAEVVADLRAPLLQGRVRGFAVFKGRPGLRLFILADEAAAVGGARLLSFDWTRRTPAKLAGRQGRSPTG